VKNVRREIILVHGVKLLLYIQATLSAAMKAVDDERTGRREAENRLRAAADSLTQRLDQQRRQTDESRDHVQALMTARNAEATAQEAARRTDQHDAR